MIELIEMKEKTFEDVLEEECDDDAYEHTLDDRAEEKRKLAQEAELKNFVFEYHEVARVMCHKTFGFVANLGKALQCANTYNARKIKKAFPGYWQKYLEISKTNKLL